MLNPIEKMLAPVSNGIKKQYDAISNSDWESTEADTMIPPLDHQVRVKKRSHCCIIFLASTVAALVFMGGIISTAFVSVRIGQLNTILAGFRDDLSQSFPVSTLTASSPSSGALSGPLHVASNPTGDELGHCGHSIEQARSLGCIFDPMSWAWQRPECYHAELVAEFLGRMDWRFYTNNETRPEDEVPREVWQRGDYRTLYVPRDWHIFHCSYAWRKFHEAFTARAPMDTDMLGMGHAKHCEKSFLHDLDPALTAPCDSWPGGCRTTTIVAGFNGCGWY